MSVVHVMDIMIACFADNVLALRLLEVFMGFVNNAGSVSRNARRLAKAVKHARNAGVFDAAGKGEPVLLRAKSVDGLENEFVRVFIDKGFDVVKLDMSKMTEEGFKQAIDSLGDDLMTTVIAYNVDISDAHNVNRFLIELLHLRHDAAEAAGFAKPHAMSLVILHDRDVKDGVSFDAISNENIDNMLSL